MKQATYRQTKAIDQNDIFEDSDEEFEKEFDKDETENAIPDVGVEDDEELVIEEFDD